MMIMMMKTTTLSNEFSCCSYYNYENRQIKATTKDMKFV